MKAQVQNNPSTAARTVQRRDVLITGGAALAAAAVATDARAGGDAERAKALAAEFEALLVEERQAREADEAAFEAAVAEFPEIPAILKQPIDMFNRPMHDHWQRSELEAIIERNPQRWIARGANVPGGPHGLRWEPNTRLIEGAKARLAACHELEAARDAALVAHGQPATQARHDQVWDRIDDVQARIATLPPTCPEAVAIKARVARHWLDVFADTEVPEGTDTRWARHVYNAILALAGVEDFAPDASLIATA